MRELANEADHKHRLSYAGVSFYLEQSTQQTIRSAIILVSERCILRAAKDLIVGVVEQLILTPLDALYIVLRINDAEVSLARGLNIVSPSILLQRYKVLKRLIDVAESPLYSLSMLNELP